MRCNHYLVSGKVQGVSFRHFTWKTATILNLLGWVRNLSDGRVEILASGPEDKIQEFESKIRTGPAHALVEQIIQRCIESSGQFNGFEIGVDGQDPID
jgi:acylphosphatase